MAPTKASVELAPEIFGIEPNTAVMHQVVTAQLAARRAGTQSTKTRAEVAGGGAKPWKQKGTGRARQGSIRSPQWAGGGVAHGPVPRDHSQRINKKMVKGALRSALADAHASGKLVVIDELAFDVPKTKQAVETLTALGFEGRVLLVLPGPSEDGNLEMVRISYAQGIGTYDVLLADHVLFTAAALDALEPAEREGGEAA